MRSGNVAPGYTFDVLPESMQDKIRQLQLDLNYRSPDAVLADPKKQWQPKIPMKDQPASAVEYAHKLKRALAYYIQNRNGSRKVEELHSIAARDWRNVFGQSVSPRHVRRTIERVLARDNGREEWSRVEIYLPETRHAAAPAAPVDSVKPEFHNVLASLESLPDVGNLSALQRVMLWNKAMMDLEDLLAAGMDEKAAKRELHVFLFARIPRLAETAKALRRQIDRKWSVYLKKGPEAICDGRRSGQRWTDDRRVRKPYTGPDSLSEDEKICLMLADKMGGGISQAFRCLYTGFEFTPGKWLQFSEGFRARYSFNPREAKSQAPRSLRDKLRPLLKSIEPLNHGPKAARLAAPSISRDWSGVAAGAWYQSDDETANHFIWFKSDEGEFEYQGMRFDVLRPQILTAADCRTDYVLSLLLICRPQYNSRDIRTLILKTCMDERIGLPFEGFYFEKGIWESNTVKNQVAWEEFDTSLSRSGTGLKLRHATTPKAKVIERIFSQEQNYMQALPGYVGRNERTDRYERVQKSKALMKRVGQPIKEEVAPWLHFMSAEQYLDCLEKVYVRFNNEPQNGKRLPGMSPAEGWKELSGGRPHQVVPDSLRYLLATERSEIKVCPDGIRIRIGGEPRCFMDSAKLGGLVGEKVLVRFNPEFPDHIICVHPKSDPLGQAPFVVQAEPDLPAMSASEEEFAEARRRRKAFTSSQCLLFRALNHAHGLTVRDELLGHPDLRAAGEAHNEVEAAEIQAKPTREAATRQARALATRAGIDPAKIGRPDRASDLEAFLEMHSRRQEIEAEKQ